MALAFPLVAQSYPFPAGTPNTSVTCTGCAGTNRYQQPNDGLPTWPYGSFSTYLGRFVDSQNTGDFTQGARTARAGRVRTAPERNRLYVIVGSTLAAYDLTAFFTTKLRSCLVDVTAFETGFPYARTGPFEKVLPFDQWYYAPATNSGWTNLQSTAIQEILRDFDWDDRGYVYLGYGPLGWGIVRDTLATDGSPMLRQSNGLTQNGGTIAAASVVLSLKTTTGSYYLLVSDTPSSSGLEVYNVTNPSAPVGPVYVGGANRGFTQWAKNSTGDRVALIDQSNNIQILSADSAVAGGASLASVSHDIANKFVSITSDGTNFWAVDAPLDGGLGSSKITKFSPSGPSYSTSQYAIGNFVASVLQYGGGYLGLGGLNSDGTFTTVDGRLFSVQSGSPVEVALNSFFAKYYSRSPSGYAMPAGLTDTIRGVLPYSHAGNLDLFWSNYGLGDVYRVSGSAGGNTAPSIVAGTGPSASQGSSGAVTSIASVSDGEDASSRLRVAVSAAPTGITLTGITNCDGVVNATLTISCTVTTGTKLVTLQVADSGGLTSTANLAVNVTANTAPALGNYSDTTIAPGDSANVTPSAPPSDNGTVSLTVSTTNGNAGVLSVSSTTGIVSVTNANAGTYTVVVTATDNCGVTATKSFHLTVSFDAPAGLIAKAKSPTTVEVSWYAVPGATFYEITRCTTGPSCPSTSGSDVLLDPIESPVVDMNVVPNTSYLYRIQAVKLVNGMRTQVSAFSNADLATTVIFTDDPLAAGVTLIKAVHVTQLRTAVNAVRALAGFGPYPFTDPAPSNQPVKAVHLTELRTVLNDARSLSSLPPATYTNTLTAQSSVIRALDWTEIRNGVK